MIKHFIMVLSVLIAGNAAAQDATLDEKKLVLKEFQKDAILQAAKNESNSTVLNCPAGMPSGDQNNLAEMVARHRSLQEKVATVLASFQNQEISKNVAIEKFNEYVGNLNEIIRWGKGKATDVCFRKSLLAISGRTTSATKLLIKQYRLSLSE